MLFLEDRRYLVMYYNCTGNFNTLFSVSVGAKHYYFLFDHSRGEVCCAPFPDTLLTSPFQSSKSCFINKTFNFGNLSIYMAPKMSGMLQKMCMEKYFDMRKAEYTVHCHISSV